jgi:hypothetical protein
MARNITRPEVLLRYHLRRAPKSLVERLECKREERKEDRCGGIFVIDINGKRKVELWVPNEIELYSSIGIYNEARKIIFANRKEENDLIPAYASVVSDTVSKSLGLFDLGWCEPQTSFKIYSVISAPSINFDKLKQELTAPNALHYGFPHPLKNI